MADQVSGLAGYNYYRLNSDGTTYTRLNSAPIADGANYVVTDLDSSTDYSGKFFVAPVDIAGNEGTKVAFTTGAQTLNPLPDEDPISDTDETNIDAIAAMCIAAGAGPGLVIAIDSPKGFLYKSYGDGTATINDYYRVASQTKSFTGTAVLRAVDQGLISLDDNLSTYLSGYALDPTIEQMLMMQSGIYDYELANIGGFLGLGFIGLAAEFTISPTMAYSVDQIIALIQAGGAMFAPGTAYYYTNSNYYVLAKIVEAVDPSQRTIDQIITQDILTPLGMVNTYFQLGTGGLTAPYSPGYDNGPFGLGLFGRRDVTDQNTNFIWAAGAIVSQITDMIIWGKELRDGTLLSSDMHDLRMTTFAQQPNAGAARFGLNFDGPPTFGYGLAQIQLGSWFGHDGSWLGHDSCTMFNPGTGTVISVYENWQTSSPHVLASLTTVFYQIAEYLYPGSTFNTDYDEGGPFTGGITSSLQPISVSASGSQYDADSTDLPFTLPGTFARTP